MVSNVLCCRDLSKAEHVSITVLIVAVCTSVSLAWDCLGVVLELNVSHISSARVAFSYLFYLSVVLFYHPGHSECHTSDLHHSICMLPQTLPRPLVSEWKPDALHLDFNWSVCHDHRFDHDRPRPSRLFAWSGAVLLCRCKCLWHCTTCMKLISSKFLFIPTELTLYGENVCVDTLSMFTFIHILYLTREKSENLSWFHGLGFGLISLSQAKILTF